MTEAYLGLGSNLGDKAGHIKSAVRLLSLCDSIEVCQVSSLYRTIPVGGIKQEDFVNAVVKIKTSLIADELFNICVSIERARGRKRTHIRWGPRTLDIDILLFGREPINSENLTIPHPSSLDRAFVLAPLVEIFPDAIIGATIARERLLSLGSSGVKPLIAFHNCQTVGIIGASAKPSRYSNKAQKLLIECGHSVVPVSLKEREVLGVPCIRSLSDYQEPLDTITVYLSPENQTDLIGEIIKCRPGRIIFNPGSESASSTQELSKSGLRVVQACTLVLLRSGQF